MSGEINPSAPRQFRVDSQASMRLLLLQAIVLLCSLWGVACVRIEYFYISASSTTVANCVSACSSASPGRNAFPAVILNGAQNAIAFRSVPVSARAVIGGSRLTGNQTVFRWVAGPSATIDGGLGRPFFNGKTLSGGQCLSYCNWATNQPDNDHDTETVLEFKYELLGKWNDSPDGYNKFTGCLCQRNALSFSAEITPSVSASFGLSQSSSHSQSASATSTAAASTTLSFTSSKNFTSTGTPSQSRSKSQNSHSKSISRSITAPNSNTSSDSLSNPAVTQTHNNSATASPSPSARMWSQSRTMRLTSTPTSRRTVTSDIGSESPTQINSSTQSALSATSSGTRSCGLPPIVTFMTARSTNSVLGGGTTSATIGIADLLAQPTVLLWLSFITDSPGSWSVAPRQGSSGAAAGSSVDVVHVTNVSHMPSFAAARRSLGEEVWRLSVAAPTGGWAVTSASQYVSQRLSVGVSLLCTNGGRGDSFDYGVVVTAVGNQLPYSGVYSVGVTFGQSMAQLASGTVVPTSLSTMRALARLASCGTTNSGSDTSYGIVSVLVPVVEPLNLSSDAELVVLNLLFCLIVSAFLFACALSVYAFLRRCVELADVLANFHLPSLLAPSMMFAFPTVLGSAIAALAQADSDASSEMTVGLLGLVLSAVWVSWVTLATAVTGPRRVVAVRLPRHAAPKLAAAHIIDVCRWAVNTVVHSNQPGYSWKGLTGEDVQQNVRWKHAYHILTQDVRFLLVPVAEAVCTTVATVATALVVVPGVGCRFAACLIALFYLAQTLIFLWQRPYSSAMMQLYSAVTNMLTVLATVALMVDIFEWELVYSVRLSVAFQLMLLGVSIAKGIIDAVEFAVGSRRLWQWIVTRHEELMDAVRDQRYAKLVVHYHEDDVVSDDGGDAMMVSLTEGPPKTPLLLLKSASSSNVFQQSTAVEEENIPSSTSSTPKVILQGNGSFMRDTGYVDDDMIHRQLRERSSNGVESKRFVSGGVEHNAFTELLMNRSLDDYAEISILDNQQKTATVADNSVTFDDSESTQDDDEDL